MKYFIYTVLFSITFCIANAGINTNVFPKLKHGKVNQSSTKGNVTYVQFSNSINGPFSNPISIMVDDSLFVKMDVTPYGTVNGEYFLDVNENGIIDSVDIQLGADEYIDNNTMPPGLVDFDSTPGVIISYIGTGDMMPSMRVIARAREGMSSAEGIVDFQNYSAPYTLSGTVYKTSGGVIPGAMVMVVDSFFNQAGDVTDINGNYSIPIQPSTYYVYVGDMINRYTPFDTIMTITDNTVQDFYLSPLTSYLRGFVKDETSAPIPNIGVWIQNGPDAVTDSNGMYIIFVPSGSHEIGLRSDDLQPTFMVPPSHNFVIAENDSIVNNGITNFTCFRTNSSITGTVRENGNIPTRIYLVNAWENTLQSGSWAPTDINGNFSIPVYNSITNPLYSVNIADWDDRYPLPPGMYPDTSYWNLSPGSVANFNIIPAETSFVDHFYGNLSFPTSGMWEYYSYGSPWGTNATLTCVNDRLKVLCNSNASLSGLGVMSKKPFSINDREYRIYVDATEMGNSNNTIRIIFADKKWYNVAPQGMQNSIQLIWEKNQAGNRQWRLVKSVNGYFTDLATSTDSTAQHILFQFIGSDTLKLKIGGVVYYNAPWGSMLSMAYVYLTEFNTDPEEPTPVYFDEFVVGYLGVTGVREIGGELPIAYQLEQNYPNPFNPVTSIRYHIPKNSYISLKLFNTLGQEVKTLVNEEQRAGNYEVTFDASMLPSGVYYYRLNAIDQSTGIVVANDIRKALLVK